MAEKQTKYIFVTGGVVSGLGKGITAASLGRLLKCRGLKVASQKLDPYVNVDPGTMSPLQHGEVFVTDDGTETDLDLGHYERFIDENLNKYSNLTTGKVYWNVLNFCNVKPECVIENLTMPSLYQCPLMLHTNGLDDVVVNKLKLDVPPADLTEWKQVVSRIATRSKTCTIALVGKYVKLHDAYLSVMESLYHAGFENDSQVEIKWVESEDLTDQNACKELFADVDGIIVPGGFGDRGIEGMIQAAQYARENNVPYFGICLGMQIMVMEFARGVLGYADANSSEFTPDGKHNVIALMADQQGNIPKGGTMRLGKYPCTVTPGTKMAECYGQTEIWERHRHRYEFNNDFRQEMQDAGLVISGTSPDGRLVETVELPGRAFHLGAQFHPEFKSRPNRAHPLFKGFIAAALKFRTSAQRSLMHL